jgi:outer membrane biosynthesis protein TonB
VFCIDTDGVVAHTEVGDGSDLHLAARMLATIRNWRFAPYAPDGQPQSVCSIVAR